MCAEKVITELKDELTSGAANLVAKQAAKTGLQKMEQMGVPGPLVDAAQKLMSDGGNLFEGALSVTNVPVSIEEAQRLLADYGIDEVTPAPSLAAEPFVVKLRCLKFHYLLVPF